MQRSKLTRFVTTAAILLLAGAAAAHPLEDAVVDAYRLCQKFDVESLEACGFMGGRSPEHTAARTAMRRVYDSRAAFMRKCQDSLERCSEQAEWYIGSGISRFNTVTFETVPPSARR